MVWINNQKGKLGTEKWGDIPRIKSSNSCDSCPGNFFTELRKQRGEKFLISNAASIESLEFCWVLTKVPRTLLNTLSFSALSSVPATA